MEVGIKARILVVLIAFLWVLANNNSQGIRQSADSDDDFSWAIPDIDEEKAEAVWIRCRRKLIESTQADANVILYPPETPWNSRDLKLDGPLGVKRMIQHIIADLPLRKRHLLLECFREEAVLHDESRKSWTWIGKWQELFSSWSSIPRRFLRGKKRRHRPVNHARAQGPVASSPAPSYRKPALSPSPTLSHHSPALQNRARAPAPSPKHRVHSPHKAIARPPSGAQRAEVVPSHHKHKEKRYIIAVSVVSTVAALALMALLVLCIVKRKERSPQIEGQREEGRDEKPLLNFCSSDVSAASSQESCSTGKPRDKISKTTAVNNLSASVNSQNSVKVETQSSEASTDTHGNDPSLLPLPPGRSAPPAPSPPPPPPPKPHAPQAPPPPKVAKPPPNPPKPGKLGPSPLGPRHKGSHSMDDTSDSSDPDAPKAKLKPFFWDKVQANPDHSMVWHEIKAGSFQFNEEMMETLFGYAPADKGKNHNRTDSSSQSQPNQIQIIDPKKAQNLAILLKALNVTTEEICDALREGNELPVELVQTLLKMAPTTEEELKLRLFSGDVSQLGPAERFLKVMVDIPFAFKRLEALLFMSSLQEDASSVTEAFATLEVACKELRNSRLFLKLLEAVLKTGNRMNDGTFRGGAQAFKLDTLLKLSDVKGTDGKTTLLHFVVQEIVRSEGLRAARRLRESQSLSSIRTEDLVEDSSQETEEYHRNLGLQVVSGLSNELENVKKAAVIDGDIITGTVANLGHSLLKTKEFLNSELKNAEEASEFCNKLAGFLEQAEADITKLLEDEKRIMDLVRNTGDYFHGNAGKDEGLRLFTIVRDFLIMLDKVCREVRNSTKWPSKTTPRKDSQSGSPQEPRSDSLSDIRLQLFPAIKERRMDFSSDDES